MTPLPHRRTAQQTRHALATDKSAVMEVVEHSLRQIEATRDLRGVVQPLPDEARRAAQQQAAQPHSGLLAGVPVTIKDCFDLVGTSAALGFASQAGELATRDAPLVARLRAAGAIVVGKTNVPQAMMLHECANPVFGQTLHPQARDRSPGGSSGGEAVAVATACSAIGLGTDLGGSIRQPAHACGLAGFKPSSGRLTLVGAHSALDELFGLAIQPGPIAHCVDDLDSAMRALSDTSIVPRQHDELFASWPDYRAIDATKLRIAWWADDGFFAPAPAVARACREAASALAAQGCEVVAAKPPDIDEAMRVFLGLVSADGLAAIRRYAGCDPLDPQIWRQLLLARVTGGRRRWLIRALAMLGQSTLAKLAALTGPRSPSEIAELQAAHVAYRDTFFAKLASSSGGPVDAVLAPPHAAVALRHGTGLDLMPAASYCFLPNLLDAPAGVIPWTTVRDDEQHDRRPGWDLAHSRARHNARGSAGLPVGVQVFAPQGEDARVLAVLKLLESSREKSD